MPALVSAYVDALLASAYVDALLASAYVDALLADGLKFRYPLSSILYP